MSQESLNLPLHKANFGIFTSCMVPEIFTFLCTDTRPDFERTTFNFDHVFFDLPNLLFYIFFLDQPFVFVIRHRSLYETTSKVDIDGSFADYCFL